MLSDDELYAELKDIVHQPRLWTPHINIDDCIGWAMREEVQGVFCTLVGKGRQAILVRRLDTGWYAWDYAAVPL